MKKKQTVSCILFLALTAALFSCEGGTAPAVADDIGTSPKETETEKVTEADPIVLPGEYDLGGRDICLWARFADEQYYESETGDIVADEIYKRNRAAEEKLNMHLSWFITETDSAEFAKSESEMLNRYCFSGEDTYDALLYSTAYLMPYRDTMLDLTEISSIDLSAPWWWEYVNRELTFHNDVRRCATGDITTDVYLRMYCLYYNKTLYNRLFGSETEPYELVESGKWTVDVFLERCAEARQDLDGDGKIDVTKDQYALGRTWDSSVISLALSMDDFDWYTVNTDDDSVMLSGFSERAADWAQTVAAILKNNDYDQNTQKTDEQFYDGSVLFQISTLGGAKRYSKNMNDSYGIIPIPKLDENQKDYQAFIEADAVLCGIFNSVKDPEASGAVLEALASYAYHKVRPKYVRSALQAKYSDDPQSSRMVELIIDSSHSNLLRNFSGDTDFGGLVLKMIENDGTNAASAFESRTKNLQKVLEKLCQSEE